MHANLFHLGHLHIPVFSAFAVVGLIVALLLSQRTAPLAGIEPETMWDAGIAATISTFVISRLLLIATNFKSFLAYPLLVLTLPSITVSGVILTGFFMIFFLRSREVSIGRVLDAASPCLALLWAIVSLGSFATGSQGMPTNLPWAIDDSVLGPIHPVEVYTALAALLLSIVLFRSLTFRDRRGYIAGRPAATGLFLGGGIAFFLDFLTQPADPTRIVLLDPIQWVALTLILLGVLILAPQVISENEPPVYYDPEAEQESNPHAV